MRTDLWLYFGIIIFFFILWVYSGGPAHPISFAGPYITPITDVGVSSTGYGNQVSAGSVGTYFNNWTGGSSNSGSNGSQVIAEAKSPFAGSVRFGTNNPQGRTNFD